MPAARTSCPHHTATSLKSSEIQRHCSNKRGPSLTQHSLYISSTPSSFLTNSHIPIFKSTQLYKSKQTQLNNTMSARSSTALFRTALRPTFASRSLVAPFSTTVSARATTYGHKDDLGGPGGQQQPPRNPGGPEALKRNWCVLNAFYKRHGIVVEL